jgi:hypothetical protein
MQARHCNSSVHNFSSIKFYSNTGFQNYTFCYNNVNFKVVLSVQNFAGYFCIIKFSITVNVQNFT